jgi:endonuclease YncB( thermonuclease family)
MLTIKDELVIVEIDPYGLPLRARPDGRNQIIDGDTLVVGGETWRIKGYDMPEITENCCEVDAEKGRMAKDYLEQLMCFGAANRSLRIYLSRQFDKTGRRLVHIWVNDENVGEHMKLHGLAADYNGRGPKPVFCDCDEGRERRQDYEDKRAIDARRRFRSAQSRV